jgi:hypothetical protein
MVGDEIEPFAEISWLAKARISDIQMADVVNEHF